MKNNAQDGQSEKFNKYSLPPPLELAKLAALLDGPDQLCRNAPEVALVIAARLYVKAVECHEHFAPLSSDDLLQNLSSTALPSRPEMEADGRILEIYTREKAKREALRLYSEHAKPTADERDKYFKDGVDEVRSFFMKHASIFNWKTTRAVLGNILRYWKDQAQTHNNLHKNAIAEYQNNFDKRYEATLRKFAEGEGRQIHAISETEASRVKKYVAHMIRPSEDWVKQTGQNLCREFLRDYALPSPARPEKQTYDPTKQTHVVYWGLPPQFLDKLIAWRREVGKRPGGATSRDSLE